MEVPRVFLNVLLQRIAKIYVWIRIAYKNGLNASKLEKTLQIHY